MRISSLLLAGAVLVQGAFAAESPKTMEDLFTRVKPLTVQQIPKKLAEFKEQDPETMKRLCEEIKAPNFYERAQQAGVGTIKNRAMVTFAEGVAFERSDLRQAQQKAKPAEKPQETVKLRPINFSKTKTVEEEQSLLKKAKQDMMENITFLKKEKQAEYQKKIEEADQFLITAQEHYDNLKAAITGLQLDMQEQEAIDPKIKQFNKDHPIDPEQGGEKLVQYMDALNVFWKGHKQGNAVQARGYVESALGLLKNANENLAKGRADLERITREMLALQNS